MILAAWYGGMGLVRLRIIARNVARDARKFWGARNSWKMFGKPIKAPKGRNKIACGIATGMVRVIHRKP
jgi:hypothetical protein